MEKEVAKKTENGEKFWQKYRTAIMVVAIFAIYLMIQLRYIGDTWFDPDELDIYGTAFEMVKGKVLYKEICSQHMPVSYFISAFFYILGAHSTVLQRLYFYIAFAALWTAYIFIYKKYVNKWVLFLQPFLFFAIIQNLEWGTQIISEHIAVMGVQMLLLEFLMFLEKRDISLASCIRISIGILLSFGTMFINIYAVFYLAIGVIALEIAWYKVSRPYIVKFAKLVLIVAVPWLIILIYMLATHSVSDFVMGAYTINREYYPKYMVGIGSSPTSMFDVGITRTAEYLTGFTFDGLDAFYIVKLFMVGCMIYMAYRIIKSKGWIAGLTFFMFVSSLGLRGFFGFHSIAYIGAATLVTTYVMVEYMFESKEVYAKKPVISKAFLAVIAALFIAFFSANLHYMLHFLKMEDMNGYKEDVKIVQTITDEEERIWQTNTCNSVSWGSLRVTTGPTVSTPYMWEAIGTEKMESFKNAPTRVVIFEEDYESFGLRMQDYAPEAYTYITDNYSVVPGSDQIWVRNDYYDEACAKLGIN